MRFIGERKKKLIVAFHFQFSDQAGWKCDDCRKHGLESARRCGWLPAPAEPKPRAVWARGGVSTTSCPKSYVTAQSLAWLDEYCAYRTLGRPDAGGLTAREVEAFLVLDNEWAEVIRGQRR